MIDHVTFYYQQTLFNKVLVLYEMSVTTCSEKVTIPKGKGNIYMHGRGIEKTIIAYDDQEAMLLIDRRIMVCRMSCWIICDCSGHIILSG